jgi:hypothetical protein
MYNNNFEFDTREF